MNLKVLFLILIYYSTLSLFFLLAISSGSSSSFDDYTSNIDLNSTGITADEVDRGGLFGTGVSFGRFAGMIGFGVGLPDDTPAWFNLIFTFWQSIVTILSLGFVVSSIWNG